MKNHKSLGLAVLVLAIVLTAQPVEAAVSDTLFYFLNEILKLVALLYKHLIVLAGQILKLYVDVIEQSLLANPQIYPLKDSAGNLTTNGAIIAGFLKILAPVYFISLLLTGLYMIFMAESPSGRASAKNNLDKLLVSMILVAVSPGLYQILVDISQVTTNGILSVVRTTLAEDETMADAIYSSLMSAPPQTQLMMLPIFMIVLWILAIALFVMWFRYLIVLVFGLIFPIIIFLYLFGFTKTFGAKMMRFALVWIFTPALSALWLAISIFLLTASASESFTGGLVTPFLFATSMFLISIAPLVMSGLMAWLGGLIAMAGMMIPGGWGIALAAIGGVMQGKDLGSIAGSTIGLELQFHKLLGKGMAAAGQKSRGGAFGALGMGGKGASAAGRATEAGGKAVSAGGKAVGGAFQAAGAAVGATGVGAPIGAALAGIGKGISAGSEAIGKGIEFAGKGMKAGGSAMESARGRHLKAAGRGKITEAKGARDRAKSLQARGDKLKSGGFMSQVRAKAGMYDTRAKLAERKAGKLKDKGVSMRNKGKGIIAESKKGAPGLNFGDTKLGQKMKKVADVAKTARGAVASKSLRLTSLAGVDRDTAKLLRTANYKTKGAVAKASVGDLQKAGLSAKQAEDASKSARSHVAGERQKGAGTDREPSTEDRIRKGIKDDKSDDADKRRMDEVQLKSQLASPGRRSRDRGQRTDDIIDGMDAE
ncbi:MAG: hypothetical protein V1921_00875 [Candidatus Altiarchaeota archaeon]